MARKKKKKRKLFSRIFTVSIILAVLVLCGMIIVDRYYPVRYYDIISEYAGKYDLDPAFVCAVIHAESKFRENAISGAGASGLMQIMEETAYWLAPQAGIAGFDYKQIFNPVTNIELGCFYLNMLERVFGDRNVVLSAYNAGSGNVFEWLGNPKYSSDGETLHTIPFPETRNYVERVAQNERIYSIILRIRS